MPGPLGYRNPLSRFEVTMLVWCECLVRGLVVRASDSRPEDLGLMSDATKYPRVHTEYVLVKSVGLKVLWAESRVQGTGEYFPPPVQWQNCGGGDRWCRHPSSFREISPSYFILSPVWCSRLSQRQANF
ncbi:uncharacterized protein TNCV_1022471 [Trichonephila clavipes]|nr:uncharacterized protein TNCV_1022471 [Trichonephila clavipes]